MGVVAEVIFCNKVTGFLKEGVHVENLKIKYVVTLTLLIYQEIDRHFNICIAANGNVVME